jgi:mannose-6-phosphate isomerase-like protein (cupin superfamily)
MAFRPPPPADVLAPDGTELWVGDSGVHGSMNRFELARGATSKAVMHRTVEEIWHVISGRGEMWRADDHGEEVILLKPDVTVTIPAGMRFQFRASNAGPLKIAGSTMPPWPGEFEAIEVAGPWTPRFDA